MQRMIVIVHDRGGPLGGPPGAAGPRMGAIAVEKGVPVGVAVPHLHSLNLFQRRHTSDVPEKPGLLASEEP